MSHGSVRIPEHELIGLAEELAGRLAGLKRNDWLRWAQLAEKHGLERAVRIAQQWGRDETLRDDIRKAYERIGQALGDRQHPSRTFGAEDQTRLMGYVGRLLRIEEEERKRSGAAARPQDQRRPPAKGGRRPPRQHRPRP